MAKFGNLSLAQARRYLAATYDVATLRRILADPVTMGTALGFIAQRDARIESWFSGLVRGGYEITSDIDRRYNCIAWAAGDKNRFWWPSPQAFWPVDRELTLKSFVAAYVTLGFEDCGSGEPEEGYEKIAIFMRNGSPTHAARLLKDGRWTSKLGIWEDVSHPKDSLCGSRESEYGDISHYMRKPRASGA